MSTRASMREVALRQSAYVFMVFIAMAFMVIAVALVADSEQLYTMIEQRRLDVCRMTKGSDDNRGFYTDHGDELLLGELPHTDFSKGGVYLIGSSNVECAVHFWRLQPEVKRYIHNFAVAGMNPEMQFQFVQFLIEHEGLLRAGGQRTMFVIGTSYQSTGPEYVDGAYFPNLAARHGIYMASKEGGFVMSVSPFVRSLIAEGVCAVSFLNTIRTDPWVWSKPAGNYVRKHNLDEYRKFRSRMMGDQWERKITTQVSYMGQMLDYIRNRGAKVVVVLLPLGSWEQTLPYAPPFNKAIVELCDNKQIDLHDWSQMLDDDEFADSVHPNVRGADKLNNAFLELAKPHLRSTGVSQD